MTTLLFDIKNKKLYTDSRATITSSGMSTLGITLWGRKRFHKDNFCKVFYNKGGRLITGSGDVGQIEDYRDRLLLGKRLPRLVNTTVFDCTIFPKLKITRHTEDTIEDISSLRWATSGSGGNFAAGVLVAGMFSPQRAMKASIQLDKGTGGAVVEYDLSGRWWDEDKC